MALPCLSRSGMRRRSWMRLLSLNFILLVTTSAARRPYASQDLRAIGDMTAPRSAGHSSRDAAPNAASTSCSASATTQTTDAPTFRSLADRNAVGIVVSTFDEDLRWLGKLRARTNVYNHVGHSRDHGNPQSDLKEHYASMSGLQGMTGIEMTNISNVGDESHAYLKHIVDEYDSLPEVVVFLHGHQTSWHQTADMLSSLACMQFPKGFRYRNLNDEKTPQCYTMNMPPLLDESKRDHLARLGKTWPLLESEMGPLNALPVWCVYCCAQFAVERSAIWAHPRSFYASLLEASMTNGKDFSYGMEYLWLAILDPSNGRRSILTHISSLAVEWARPFQYLCFVVVIAGVVAISVRECKLRLAAKLGSPLP